MRRLWRLPATWRNPAPCDCFTRSIQRIRLELRYRDFLAGSVCNPVGSLSGQ